MDDTLHDPIRGEVHDEAALKEAVRLARAFRLHMLKHGMGNRIVGGCYVLPEGVIVYMARESAARVETDEQLRMVLSALPEDLIEEAGIT